MRTNTNTIRIRKDIIDAGSIACIGLLEPKNLTVAVDLKQRDKPLEFTCRTEKQAARLLTKAQADWSRWIARLWNGQQLRACRIGKVVAR
jgi:hypothetical protein